VTAERAAHQIHRERDGTVKVLRETPLKICRTHSPRPSLSSGAIVPEPKKLKIDLGIVYFPVYL
jgi:hypothetical protein